MANKIKDVEPSAVPKGPSFPRRPEPTTFGQWMEYFLLEYRFLFVIPFVLPASYIYQKYWNLRDFFIRTIGKNFRNHDDTVRYIQKQIKTWKKSGSKNLLCTARPSFLSISIRPAEYKQKDNCIDLPLYDILELDEDRRTVRVEPSVNVGQLTDFLVPKGWTIAVVPEFEALTFGGLLNGYGIESSSHKHGLFNDIVVSVDVVLGDASVVTCSATKNSDLFRALPWSHGALGFVVAIEIQIIPCKKYCRLVYEPSNSMDQTVDRFTELCIEENPNEFVEALQYSYNKGVITHGNFCDEAGTDGYVNSIGYWFKPWWFRHAENLANKNEKTVEYIPLREYYHRHTKSLFWEMELILPMGNHWLFRWVLGWLMPPSISFLKGTQSDSIKEYYVNAHIVQDYLLPIEKLKESLDVSHKLYEIYPLWLCPHAVYRTEPQGAIRAPTNKRQVEMYADVGIWFTPKAWERGEYFDGHQATKDFEKWLRENRGYQATYAVSEQTREEFWQMFDGTLYKQCRKKYGAEDVFVDTFDKVHGKRKKL